MSEEVSVTEGKATLYFASKKGVFYNPAQIPNRDLSVLALQEFAEMWAREPTKRKPDRGRSLRYGPAVSESDAPVAAVGETVAAVAGPAASGSGDAEPEVGPSAGPAAAARPGLRVLDALSASGLRAMRYSLEVPGLREVVANDVDPVAVAVLRTNLERNGLAAPAVVSHVADAAALLHASRPPLGHRFDVVDLDPYGTAAPFLDSAVQAVSEEGLLMVTCTDMAVLAGAYPEACYAKYGAFPLKTKHCHEQALRILLACIDSHAARHGRYITPLLCVHINFYVRVFVRVRTGKSSVKLSPTKVSYLYSCSGCNSFALQPMARVVDRGSHERVSAGAGPPVAHHCAHCGRVHHVGGPMWSAPMHDTAFIAALLRRLDAPGGQEFGAHKRLVGLLTLCGEELPDVPLFMHLAHMCSTLHLPCPQMAQVLSALARQGHRVSRSHTDPMAIKTDAPTTAIWDVLRCWSKHPECLLQLGKRKVDVSGTSPAATILQMEPTVQADFTILPEVAQMLSSKKVSKFMPNPAQWGPGSRGTSHASFGAGAAADGGAEAGETGEGTLMGKKHANQGKRKKMRAERQSDGGQPPGKRVAVGQGVEEAGEGAEEAGEGAEAGEGIDMSEETPAPLASEADE